MHGAEIQQPVLVLVEHRRSQYIWISCVSYAAVFDRNCCSAFGIVANMGVDGVLFYGWELMSKMDTVAH